MPTYRNLSGDSGILAYEYGNDWIEVEFRSGRWRFYTYTCSSAGQERIEQMKILANAGRGLNAYIDRHVAKLYASKR